MEQLLVDMDKLMVRMEGDRELIKEVFTIFVEEAPARRMKFEKALIVKDLGAMAMLAHALKGACGTLEADPLRQACNDLEHAARGGDADKVLSVCPNVLELLDKTAGFMAELTPGV
jgi:HPt (histidine-containing phosphotransfer) domain-containing protein